ncbi:DeoR family transcriptional regulator [Salimicrobium jeotgali]|uniref:DeoR family transcriptional regulator n=2 Tax=Salimicrobium jeotgali TaxID=1230341 RepID=K2GL01_9BACI|nr:DeoR/GlpR family DNA-binding transcription regulator [Salimicrobium jeotgali]AKG05480.1 DeoR family transcriptional regulator [Salimicrobium jeotgali]EKE31054.1 Glycerol-3-phosphate regulon repressor [Salimicrobium jeotgali]
MYQEERLEGIIVMIREQGRVRLEEICSSFQVSRDTARRDLVKLAERGEVTRMHGGAILPKSGKERMDYTARLQKFSAEKKKIARAAASLIREGDSIIFDTSTTVQAISAFIDVLRFAAVTNSIYAAELLAETNADINLLGGQLNKEQRFLYGPSVLAKLEEFYADKLFVGTFGISEEGLSSYHEEDGYVKKMMMKRADEVIVVADHSKLEKRGFYTFSSLEGVDKVLTDREPSSFMKDVFDEYNVEWIVAT